MAETAAALDRAVPYHAVHLKTQHDEQFFESLFERVKRLAAAFERPLQERREG